MIDEKTRAWLESKREQAKQRGQEQCTPEVVTGYYAVGNVMGTWKISNGKTWWDDPVLVQEIHEHAGGCVTMHQYIDGVGMFGRQEVEESGLRAIRPAELETLFPVSKVVYIDHRKRDNRGRAFRMFYDLQEVAG